MENPFDNKATIANKYGVDESIDSFTQLAQLELFIRDQLADGFSVIDALNVGLKAFPMAQELIKDWVNLKGELGDIREGELRLIEVGVRQRLGDAANQSSLVAIIDTVATGDELVRRTVADAIALYGKAQTIVK